MGLYTKVLNFLIRKLKDESRKELGTLEEIDTTFRRELLAKKEHTEKDVSLISCIFSGLIYEHDSGINERLAYLGLNNDSYSIHNIDNELVFGLFVLNKKIFIVFKGSSDLNDFFSDLNFLTVDPEIDIPGKVHKGFFDILFEKCQDIPKDADKTRADKIKDLISQYPDTTEIVITGHSLGAATGSIFYAFIKESIPNKLRLITFGSPRVGNITFSKYISECHRIVNSDDIVTKIPLPLGYYHADTRYQVGALNRFFNVSLKDHSISRYYTNLLLKK